MRKSLLKVVATATAAMLLPHPSLAEPVKLKVEGVTNKLTDKTPKIGKTYLMPEQPFWVELSFDFNGLAKTSRPDYYIADATFSFLQSGMLAPIQAGKLAIQTHANDPKWIVISLGDMPDVKINYVDPAISLTFHLISPFSVNNASTLALDLTQTNGFAWWPRWSPNVISGNVTAYDLSSASAVPEPATWGMMILGLGAVGGVMRRRRMIMTAQLA